MDKLEHNEKGWGEGGSDYSDIDFLQLVAYLVSITRIYEFFIYLDVQVNLQTIRYQCSYFGLVVDNNMGSGGGCCFYMAHTIFMSLGLLIMNMMGYSQEGYTTYWEQLDLDNNLRVITE